MLLVTGTRNSRDTALWILLEGRILSRRQFGEYEQPRGEPTRLASHRTRPPKKARKFIKIRGEFFDFFRAKSSSGKTDRDRAKAPDYANSTGTEPRPRQIETENKLNPNTENILPCRPTRPLLSGSCSLKLCGSPLDSGRLRSLSLPRTPSSPSAQLGRTSTSGGGDGSAAQLTTLAPGSAHSA